MLPGVAVYPWSSGSTGWSIRSRPHGGSISVSVMRMMWFGRTDATSGFAFRALACAAVMCAAYPCRAAE